MNQKPYPGQTNVYEGKVRRVCTVGKVLVAETTNQTSAFDVVLPFEVTHKGAVLNQITQYFMKATEDICPNCLLDVPAPHISIWRKLETFPFEVIVRAYNTGSFYRNYTSVGKANPWGYKISKDIKKNEIFPELLITPTTKAEKGDHDEDISWEELIKRGLVTRDEKATLERIATELFQRGQQMAKERELILVDTKYEFGKSESGEIYLIDEIHTPDSSRYWYTEGYEQSFAKGEDPRHLSKEFVREWLMEQGYQGRPEDIMPAFTPEFTQSISERYLELYEKLTGNKGNFVIEEKPDAYYEKVCASLVKIRPQIEGARVSIVMGSQSDLNIMKLAANVLAEAGIPFELGILSAHRTPHDLEMFALHARHKGVRVIIAGAGGAAHLPGMIAASTTLPVIGVPVKSSNSIDGWDSILSILQMPSGVPVATVALDGAGNAALIALQILGTSDTAVANYLSVYKEELKKKVSTMRQEVSENYFFSLIN